MMHNYRMKKSRRVKKMNEQARDYIRRAILMLFPEMSESPYNVIEDWIDELYNNKDSILVIALDMAVKDVG